MKLTFKKLKDNATIPHSATKTSAGLDLHACLDEPMTIGVGEIKTVPTGIACAPEREDVVMLVFVRSSLGRKFGLTLANSVGVIDSDYRGEYIVCLHNDTDSEKTVANGDRIAQLVIMPFLPAEFIETDELDETARGEGGFGSTGK